jgi:ubiquinone/menaquinone biosynthesis C-methylase UbiE
MSIPIGQSATLEEEIVRYYRRGKEAGRLATGIGLLEHERTKELIRRYLPEAPQAILDIGGGPGVYACWLAREGYDVHLIDAVPLHIEQARQASREQPNAPLASCLVGDARHIDLPDNFCDAVLLNGPLYHLLERADRLLALRECRRLLRPQGLLMAAGISRFASLHVGLERGWIADNDFRAMVKKELADGKHLPPDGWPSLFTTAYFHHPEELTSEVVEAGFTHLATLAVEGAGWLLPDLEERWQVAHEREALLTAVRWTEQERAVIGISPHIIAVARA